MKKVLLILLMISMTLCITGCQYNKNKKAAINEASKYIKEKYGITVKKKDVMDIYIGMKEHGQYNFTPDYTGTAVIKFYYNPDHFKVVVNYQTKDKSTYYDNFEADKIISDLTNLYKSSLGLSNIRVYVPEDFILNPINNKKYNNNINDYLSKLGNDKQYTIVIITTDSISKSKVQQLTAKYTNTRIILYEVSNYIEDTTLEPQYDTRYKTDGRIENIYKNNIKAKYDCTNNQCQ